MATKGSFIVECLLEFYEVHNANNFSGILDSLWLYI